MIFTALRRNLKCNQLFRCLLYTDDRRWSTERKCQKILRKAKNLSIFRKWMWKVFRWVRIMPGPISGLKILFARLSSRNKKSQVVLTGLRNWENWRDYLVSRFTLIEATGKVESGGRCADLGKRCHSLKFPIPAWGPILLLREVKMLSRVPSEKEHVLGAGA